MIKITNATIVTVNDEFDIIKNGDIIIQDNIIKYVGKNLKKQDEQELTKGQSVQTIDANGNIVMPGLINTHCHAPMTLFRGMAEQTVFEDWWIKKIKPLEDKLTSQDIYNGATIAVKEMLQNGITTFFDLYFDYKQTIKASKEAGIRLGVGFGAISGKEVLTIDSLEKELKYLKDSNVIPFLYAHAPYSVDESQFETLIRMAQKHKLVLCTHASETLNEVGVCHKKHGVTPIGLLESYGALDVKTVLAHCVHCDKDDIEILKNYDVTVSTNPGANLKLGSGVAPIYSFVKNNVKVAIGTDGVAGNNSLDMFKEMYLTAALQYGTLNDPSLLSAEDIIKMATVDGALAYGVNNLGVIKKGYVADLIMLDVSQPNLQPLNDIATNIVFSANPKNVVMTMVDGKIVYNSFD